jgi:hypothetical protein
LNGLKQQGLSTCAVTFPLAEDALVSERGLFETQRILPISGHKEALQVKLPGGLMKETRLGMVIEITGVED